MPKEVRLENFKNNWCAPLKKNEKLQKKKTTKKNLKRYK